MCRVWKERMGRALSECTKIVQPADGGYGLGYLGLMTQALLSMVHSPETTSHIGSCAVVVTVVTVVVVVLVVLVEVLVEVLVVLVVLVLVVVVLVVLVVLVVVEVLVVLVVLVVKPEP